MVDFTPLNLTDSLENFLSLLVFALFQAISNSEDIAWLSSLQTLLTNLNFHIAKYFSVIYLLYLFQSLVYQTFITLNSEG